ncbi:HlyD family type I secretion periplasmic adaptor subunit [Sediminicoccus sp. BL-A-41-H5]|uniref:HlyD family type I secretion periplasmic adaptor subunit n=1 Tax=Sediminicoccus sp. BL-A-41-H5 TaxID=3421106 RepID=UPI003D6780BA
MLSQLSSRRPFTEGGASLEALSFVSPTAAIVEQPPPRGARTTIWLVAGLFASSIALMGLLPIDRVVAAPGRVVSQAATVTIQPIETAIVRSVEVRPNQIVRAGQILARLDPTFAVADLSTIEAQAAALSAEVARLQAEADGVDYIPTSSPQALLQATVFAQRRAELGFRMDHFGQRMESLQAGVDRAQSEIVFLQRRLGVLTQIESMRENLARQEIGSRLNLLLAADSRLEVSRALSAAEGTVRTAERDIEAIRAERNAFLGQWRTRTAQDLATRRTEFADADERLNKARLRRTLVEMRAPMDAVVLEFGRTAPGAVLQSGELLMTLVPLNAPLEVEADIQARDMGFIAPGDRVAVKLEAYNFVRHGLARGAVRTVSEDTFGRDSNQPGREQNTQLRPAFYRARIAIEDISELRNLPADFRLTPGMPVAADIVVGHRTILSYLFESAMSGMSRGMREP